MTYISQVPKFPYDTRCVVVGCNDPGNTTDHVLFGQKKGKRVSVAMKRWLQSAYNLQKVCLKHNIDHLANTLSARDEHIRRIVGDEGWVKIAIWLSECPKEKFKLRDDFQEVCEIVKHYAGLSKRSSLFESVKETS